MTHYPNADEPDSAFQCITCSDQALPARVLSVDVQTVMAVVSLQSESATSEVDVSLLDAVAPGDVLLVHGGVALSHLPGGGPITDVQSSPDGVAKR